MGLTSYVTYLRASREAGRQILPDQCSKTIKKRTTESRQTIARFGSEYNQLLFYPEGTGAWGCLNGGASLFKRLLKGNGYIENVPFLEMEEGIGFLAI